MTTYDSFFYDNILRMQFTNLIKRLTLIDLYTLYTETRKTINNFKVSSFFNPRNKNVIFQKNPTKFDF